ncbi:hypothetical protein H0H93_014388 [Arthromyces matolae]|nr:hypothetical protein H0H93_014388 [Arthromyces matolae]
MAMAEATKLFDKAGGGSSGNKQDAVNGAAMTVMKLLVQSKFGGGGSFFGGGNSGGISGLLSLADIDTVHVKDIDEVKEENKGIVDANEMRGLVHEKSAPDIDMTDESKAWGNDKGSSSGVVGELDEELLDDDGRRLGVSELTDETRELDGDGVRDSSRSPSDIAALGWRWEVLWCFGVRLGGPATFRRDGVNEGNRDDAKLICGVDGEGDRNAS